MASWTVTAEEVDPATDYRPRLTDRESRVKTLDASLERFGTARLTVAVLVLIAAWFAFARHAFSPVWLLAGVGTFAALVIAHQAALRNRARAARAAGFY